MKWDVFISHASEDKQEVARPLAQLLADNGLRVWLDEQELVLGDSFRQKIEEGLRRSSWGVVIVSPSFLDKKWPQTELDALLAAESSGQPLILPVWHRVTAQEVAERSPILASRLAIDTSKGLDSICRAILRAVAQRERAAPTGTDADHAVQSLEEYWFKLSSSDLHRTLLAKQNRFGRVGQYILKEFIGLGGTGAVFRGNHALFGRTVAFKLFFPVRDEFNALSAATVRAVRGLGSLRDVGVASLVDFGTLSNRDGRTTYLVYDFVDGTPLDSWSVGIAHDPRAVQRRLKVACTIAKTLGACHKHKFVGNLGFEETGVLHGDIKPANVLVDSADQPVLLDFMTPDIHRLLAERSHSQSFWIKDEAGHFQWDQPPTALFGTPGYMPPEQELDGIVLPVSDVYALGKTFGRLFWPSLTPEDRALQEIRAGNRRRSEVDEAIEVLIDNMTAAQPQDRSQSMEDVVARIERIRAAFAFA